MRTFLTVRPKKVKSSQRAGVGTDAEYVPGWVHFSQMQFLRDVFKVGPSQDNMEQNPVLETRLVGRLPQIHLFLVSL